MSGRLPKRSTTMPVIGEKTIVHSTMIDVICAEVVVS
mgnify:CR=1 FL=1